MSTHILRVACPDRPGIVAAVANILQTHNCNIEDASQFSDHLSGHFFMRLIFSPLQQDRFDMARLHADFKTIGDTFEMGWQIRAQAVQPRVLIMASRHDHCLHDLLYRWSTGHLAVDITAIVSNHETLQPLAARHGLSFHHLPVSPDNKSAQETALDRLINTTKTELVVLARYMQVLSDDFCARYPGRIINIHHSFLPGFKGARPYQQAYERGVKIIGATAHFVTADLDEGPIIEQQTARVDHTMDAAAMQTLGRDTEAQVLSRAVRYYTEGRIFLHGGRTVIL